MPKSSLFTIPILLRLSDATAFSIGRSGRLPLPASFRRFSLIERRPWTVSGGHPYCYRTGSAV